MASMMSRSRCSEVRAPAQPFEVRFLNFGIALRLRRRAPAASAAGFLLTLFYGSRAHSATFGWRLMGSFITVQLKRGQ